MQLNSLPNFPSYIPIQVVSAIESALQKLKDAHKAGDITAIDAAIAELNNAWHAASQQMYQGGAQAGAGQQQNAGAQNNNANAGSSSDDNIQDADFEEVK